MRWIDSSVELVEDIDSSAIIKKVEIATRTCYRSEDMIADGTAEKLIRNCIKRGHESVLEHGALTFKIVCDRAIMAEITRHRLASYSVESTRYCAYNKDKFGGELSFVKPWWIELPGYDDAVVAIDNATFAAEKAYLDMLKKGFAPDVARCVLPNCLATTIVVTMNMREIRHFLQLRLSNKAHPDIRIIANKIMQMMVDNGLGVFVEDIGN
jgi:thymidylate synthase (FAD)